MIMPQRTRELPATCGPTPEEAARSMRSRNGFVFLESTLASTESISLLAWEPDLILEGSASNWHALERELAARQRPGADLGFPDGAAIGWVGFDGSFRFGFYAKLALFLHGTSSWQSPLELPGIAALPSFSRIPFRARLGKRQFEEMVMAAQEYIAAGDIYQVCLSHDFDATGPVDQWLF